MLGISNPLSNTATLMRTCSPWLLQVWLLLDGMVLDVGRWLPEHPGGATIIPKQSLDCDCGRFFEVWRRGRGKGS